MSKRRRPKRLKRHHLKRWSSAMLPERTRAQSQHDQQDTILFLMRESEKRQRRDRLILGEATPKYELPRVVAQDRMLLIDCAQERHIMLLAGRLIRELLFYDTNQTKFWIIKYDYVMCKISRSLNYGSRSRAMTAHRRRQVVWKDHCSIEPIESPG